jgi:hypothetical protein
LNGGEIRIDTILNSEVFDKIYPNLRVIARCRPDDKYAMVTGLRERGDQLIFLYFLNDFLNNYFIFLHLPLSKNFKHSDSNHMH